MLEQQFVIGRTLYPSSTVGYIVDPDRHHRHRDRPVRRAPGWSGAASPSAARPSTTAATYRITVNNFLAGGGDGFSVLTGGTNQVTGLIDLDAFMAYLTAKSPVSAPALDRIRTTAEVPAA